MGNSNDNTSSEEDEQTYRCPTERCTFIGALPEFIFDEEDIDKGEIYVCRQCNERIPKSQLIEVK